MQNYIYFFFGGGNGVGEFREENMETVEGGTCKLGTMQVGSDIPSMLIDGIRNLEHPYQSNVCWLNSTLQVIANTQLKEIFLAFEIAENAEYNRLISSIREFVIKYDEHASFEGISTALVRQVRLHLKCVLDTMNILLKLPA